MRKSTRGLIVGASALTLALAIFVATLVQVGVAVREAEAQAVRPPESAVNREAVTTAGGSVRPPAPQVADAPAGPGERAARDFLPGVPEALQGTALETQGGNSNASIWREVRAGEAGTVSIPNAQAGVLIQSWGAEWKDWRAKDGPLAYWGLVGIGGMLAALALFYLIRGRIRIEHGRSGVTIERFGGLERFGHWLLAGSFVLLALTGLNLLFGKDYLMPLIGKEAFAQVSIAGKWVHNNVAWPFMAALVLVFVMWVLHNLPSRHDLVWLAKGGGLFVKGVHPPSRKFNAGQKLIFWSTILLGVSVSLSGLSLLFPFELPMFAKTFEVLNGLGAAAVLGGPLPVDLTPMQEMQYAQIWHTIVALAMIVIIVAHIYIGSLGMEGAFDAMGSGQVDRNWAIEHHGLWVEEMEGRRPRPAPGAAATPAE